MLSLYILHILIKKYKSIRQIVSLMIILSLLFSQGPAYAYNKPTLFGRKSHAQRYIKDEKPTAINILEGPSLVDINKKYGKVLEWYKAKKSDKLIIHIQDRHVDEIAQLNIAGAVGELTDKYKIHLLSLEGASKELDTSFYDKFPDGAIKEKVSRFFVKKGLFTGAEYYKITHKEQYLRTKGVENKALYLEHLASYKGNQIDRETTLKFIAGIKHALDALKDRIYSKHLKKLYSKSLAYNNKTIQIAEYLQYLTNVGAASGREYSPLEYPNITAFLALIKKEEKVDFSKAQKQREALIKQLSETLKEDNLKELLEKSLAFRLSKITDKEFYHYLKTLIEVRNVGAASGREQTLAAGDGSYNDLFAYIDYIEYSTSIDYLELFGEVEILEEQMIKALCKNDTQLKLSHYLKAVYLLEELYNLRLTNEKLEFINRHPKYFKIRDIQNFIKTNTTRYGLNLNTKILTSAITEKAFRNSIDFYQIALKRDIALVGNTLSDMKKLRKDKAILITGGFHTAGITNILKKEGVSYVVICPNVGGGDYEKIHKDRMAGTIPDAGELLEFFNNMLVPPLASADAAPLTVQQYARVAFAMLCGVAEEIAKQELGKNAAWNPFLIKESYYVEQIEKEIAVVIEQEGTITLQRAQKIVHDFMVDPRIAKAITSGKARTLNDDMLQAAIGVLETYGVSGQMAAEELRKLHAKSKIRSLDKTSLPEGITGHPGKKGIYIVEADNFDETVERLVHETIAYCFPLTHEEVKMLQAMGRIPDGLHFMTVPTRPEEEIRDLAAGALEAATEQLIESAKEAVRKGDFASADQFLKQARAEASLTQQIDISKAVPGRIISQEELEKALQNLQDSMASDDEVIDYMEKFDGVKPLDKMDTLFSPHFHIDAEGRLLPFTTIDFITAVASSSLYGKLIEFILTLYPISETESWPIVFFTGRTQKGFDKTEAYEALFEQGREFSNFAAFLDSLAGRLKERTGMKLPVNMPLDELRKLLLSDNGDMLIKAILDEVFNLLNLRPGIRKSVRQKFASLDNSAFDSYPMPKRWSLIIDSIEVARAKGWHFGRAIPSTPWTRNNLRLVNGFWRLGPEEALGLLSRGIRGAVREAFTEEGMVTFKRGREHIPFLPLSLSKLPYGGVPWSNGSTVAFFEEEGLPVASPDELAQLNKAQAMGNVPQGDVMEVVVKNTIPLSNLKWLFLKQSEFDKHNDFLSDLGILDKTIVFGVSEEGFYYFEARHGPNAQRRYFDWRVFCQHLNEINEDAALVLSARLAITDVAKSEYLNQTVSGLKRSERILQQAILKADKGVFTPEEIAKELDEDLDIVIDVLIEAKIYSIDSTDVTSASERKLHLSKAKNGMPLLGWADITRDLNENELVRRQKSQERKIAQKTEEIIAHILDHILPTTLIVLDRSRKAMPAPASPPAVPTVKSMPTAPTPPLPGRATKSMPVEKSTPSWIRDSQVFITPQDVPMPVRLEIGNHAFLNGLTQDVAAKIVDVASRQDLSGTTESGRSLIIPLTEDNYLHYGGKTFKAIRLKLVTYKGEPPKMEAYVIPPDEIILQPVYKITFGSENRIRIGKEPAHPTGGGYLYEAMNEYFTMANALQNGIDTGYPLGIGQFTKTDMKFEGKKVGFVVMAMEETEDIRAGNKVYKELETASSLSDNNREEHRIKLRALSKAQDKISTYTKAAAQRLRKLAEAGMIHAQPHLSQFDLQFRIYDFTNAETAQGITKEEFTLRMLNDFRALYSSSYALSNHLYAGSYGSRISRDALEARRWELQKYKTYLRNIRCNRTPTEEMVSGYFTQEDIDAIGRSRIHQATSIENMLVFFETVWTRDNLNGKNLQELEQLSDLIPIFGEIAGRIYDRLNPTISAEPASATPPSPGRAEKSMPAAVTSLITPTGSSLALKDIGDEDAKAVPGHILLEWQVKSDDDDEIIKSFTASINGRDVQVRVITDSDDAPMPSGMSAYHIYDNEKETLTVIIRSNIDINSPIAEEVIYHEMRETHWIKRGYTSQEAHRLAAAEEIIKFGFDKGRTEAHITNYHKQQLDSIVEEENYEKLLKLLTENRSKIHSLVSRVLGERETELLRSYELTLRDEIKTKMGIAGEVSHRDSQSKGIDFERTKLSENVLHIGDVKKVCLSLRCPVRIILAPGDSEVKLIVRKAPDGKYYLFCENNHNNITLLELPEGMTEIGRKTEAGIKLGLAHNGFVSGKHLNIIRQADEIIIEDTASTNYTDVEILLPTRDISMFDPTPKLNKSKNTTVDKPVYIKDFAAASIYAWISAQAAGWLQALADKATVATLIQEEGTAKRLDGLVQAELALFRATETDIKATVERHKRTLQPGIAARNTTGANFVESVEAEEAENILYNMTDIRGYPVRRNMLTPDKLKDYGLAPKYRVSASETVMYVSRPYLTRGNRIALVGYVRDPEGAHNKPYIARTFYISNSQGMWRLLPYYSMKTETLRIKHYDKAWERIQDALRKRYGEGLPEGRISHYGKLWDEASIMLPVEFMCAFFHILNTEEEVDLTHTYVSEDTTAAELVFAGTTKERKVYAEIGRSAISAVIGIDEEPIKLEGAFYTSYDKKIPPAWVKFKNLENLDAPDFSKEPEYVFEFTSPVYGGVKAEALTSKNRKYRYLFYRDLRNRVWIGGIELLEDNPITSLGVRKRWVDGGCLTVPLYEYWEQTGGYGNPVLVAGNNRQYGSMWKNYLSKIPIIQDYIKARGLTVLGAATPPSPDPAVKSMSEADIQLPRNETDVNLAAGLYSDLVPHESGVNLYIEQHLPFGAELRADTPKQRAENLAKLIEEKKAKVIGHAGKRPIVALPIEGLLEHRTQFGHIGLGRAYGDYIIAWIDEKYLNNDTVISHELYEINKWESLRRALVITRTDVKNYKKYLAEEQQDNRITKQQAAQLYEKARTARGKVFLPEMMRFFIRHYYETPLDRDVFLGDGEVIKIGTTSTQIAEKWHDEAPSLDALSTQHKIAQHTQKAETAITAILGEIVPCFVEIQELIQERARDFAGETNQDISKILVEVRPENIRDSLIGTRVFVHDKYDQMMSVSYVEDRIELHALLDFMEFFKNDDELKWAVAHEIAHKIVSLYLKPTASLSYYFQYIKLLTKEQRTFGEEWQIREAVQYFMGKPAEKQNIEKELQLKEWLSDEIGRILAKAAGANVHKAAELLKRFEQFDSPNLQVLTPSLRITVKSHPDDQLRAKVMRTMSGGEPQQVDDLADPQQKAVFPTEQDINLGALIAKVTAAAAAKGIESISSATPQPAITPFISNLLELEELIQNNEVDQHQKNEYILMVDATTLVDATGLREEAVGLLREFVDTKTARHRPKFTILIRTAEDNHSLIADAGLLTENCAILDEYLERRLGHDSTAIAGMSYKDKIEAIAMARRRITGEANLPMGAIADFKKGDPEKKHLDAFSSRMQLHDITKGIYISVQDPANGMVAFEAMLANILPKLFQYNTEQSSQAFYELLPAIVPAQCTEAIGALSRTLAIIASQA